MVRKRKKRPVATETKENDQAANSANVTGHAHLPNVEHAPASDSCVAGTGAADSSSDQVIQESWPPWMLEDLAKSGIPAELAQSLGIRPAGSEELRHTLGFGPRDADGQSCDGYLIPFHDPVNRQPLSCRNGRPYIRARLRKPAMIGDGEAKYLSPVDAGQHAYILPRVHKYLDDDKFVPFVSTEGEKKAIAATCAGLPTVGLAGNWGWKNPDDDSLLPELERYAGHRDWLVIFDSDGESNPQFRNSIIAWARVLQDHGAQLRVVFMPDLTPGAKTGLDDFIQQIGGRHGA
jgi:hypothetical protein